MSYQQGATCWASEQLTALLSLTISTPVGSTNCLHISNHLTAMLHHIQAPSSISILSPTAPGTCALRKAHGCSRLYTSACCCPLTMLLAASTNTACLCTVHGEPWSADTCALYSPKQQLLCNNGCPYTSLVDARCGTFVNKQERRSRSHVHSSGSVHRQDTCHRQNAVKSTGL